MSELKSAASVEVSLVERCAPCGIPEVRLFPEYAELKCVEDATAILNDGIATKTILRSNGKALESFPSYYGLRFLATQEGDEKIDRGFYKANNSRRVRAAALKVYENSPKPSSDGSTTIRTKTAKVPDSITIPWMGDVQSTLDNAFYPVLAHAAHIRESEAAGQVAAASKIAAAAKSLGVTIEQLKALVAAM